MSFSEDLQQFAMNAGDVDFPFVINRVATIRSYTVSKGGVLQVPVCATSVVGIRNGQIVWDKLSGVDISFDAGGLPIISFSPYNCIWEDPLVNFDKNTNFVIIEETKEPKDGNEAIGWYTLDLRKAEPGLYKINPNFDGFTKFHKENESVIEVDSETGILWVTQ